MIEPKEDRLHVSPLALVLQEVGKESPNYSNMAESLIKASKAILGDLGYVRDTELLYECWKEQTNSGISPKEELDVAVEIFQKDLETIASLKEPYDAHVFYVPGSSGIVRLTFGIDRNSKACVVLIDSGGSDSVEENFEKIRPK